MWLAIDEGGEGQKIGSGRKNGTTDTGVCAEIRVWGARGKEKKNPRNSNDKKLTKGGGEEGFGASSSLTNGGLMSDLPII